MPKSKARRKKSTSPQPNARNKRKSLFSIALVLMLSIVTIVFAQWRSLHRAFNPFLPSPTPSPAFQLSKEYIYAGGRLTATEEPVSTLTVPTNFTVHATTTTEITTQITLSWASTGAPSYLIERSTNYTATNNGFTALTTVDCTSGCSNSITFTDAVPASPVTTYLYRVRSVSGLQQSAQSTFDFATTKSFAEQIQNQDPNRTPVRATHFLELRDAVNAVRAAAGLTPFSWSDSQGRVPASDVPILKSHMQDLRDGLDQALSALGFTPQAYTDQGLPNGTSVQKAHVDELRQRTKGVGQ